MVGYFAKNLEVSFTTKKGKTETLNYGHQHVVDDLSITWGRSSLFESPAKRTATISVKYETAWNNTKFWKPLLRGQVIIKQNKRPLFIGFIDTVTPVRFNSSQWIMHITAVEAFGWRQELSGTMKTRAAWPGLLKASIKLQSKAVQPTLRDEQNREVEFNPPPQLKEITYADAWGAVVAARPLSRPVWSPDYSTVSSSIYRPISRDPDIDLPGNAVSGEMPLFDAMHQPQSVRFSTDGSVYGATSNKSNIWETFNAFGSAPLTNWEHSHLFEIKPLYSVTSWPQNMIRDSVRLLQLQEHAPRVITLTDETADNVIENLSGFETFSYLGLFDTTENKLSFTIKENNNTISDPVRQLFGETFAYSAIGGRLHVKNGVTRHHLTCIIVGRKT